MYNSKEYWNKRKNPNKGSLPEEVDKKFIPEFLKGLPKPHAVLELGVGVGRMFPFYKGLNVTGVDFAGQYSDQCFKKAKECGLKDYDHHIVNVHKGGLASRDSGFDKGLLIKVLLHAPHDECITILKEMGRVCKEVLVISYNGSGEGLAPHCFKHDYKKMLDELGFKYESTTFGNQIIIRYNAE
jgi:hypothetical protein